MALVTAQILTPWVGTGVAPADTRRPKLADDYPAIQSWTDATGQPAADLIPDPNAYVIEATLDDTVLAQIEADPSYGQGAVLWSRPA